MLFVDVVKDVLCVLVELVFILYFVSFGVDGIDLEFGFWIEDLVKGMLGVCLSVNCNIWWFFSEYGILILFL